MSLYHTLNRAIRGHQFFTAHPQVMADFEQAVRELGIAGIFAQAAANLHKEKGEATVADDTLRSIKGNIYHLSSTLRSHGSRLRRAIDALLDLEGLEDIEISMPRTENDIEDYHMFAQQAEAAIAKLSDAGSLPAQLEKFRQDLTAYEQARGQIGDATQQAADEKNDVIQEVIEHEDLLIAANAAVREYLRSTNHDLYREYVGKK